MVELLIALFLGSLVTITFYQLFITQNRHTLFMIKQLRCSRT